MANYNKIFTLNLLYENFDKNKKFFILNKRYRKLK